ncbi:MAG: isoleucine--tRNA ligase [Anaerolineae bacterium]|nr:isoleucine--tRNA ligase [Anaerolineae bacterium]
MFKPVSAKVNIPAVENEQLEFWRKRRIFERTQIERKGGPRFVFYEGPPTANGKPGTHHVLARAYKDMFPRYKTMNGYYVLRKGGWDTHGLPVEIEVEKELGLHDKREIEAYGVAAFNEKCRQSVFRYINEWEKLTERMAFWVSLDDAYVTFTNDYIQSVWWILRQLWDKGLLYRGKKVVPYCARCGTPLSSHEVAQGYEDVSDPSIFVRFPLRDEPGTYFLVWTTTPWTLPGNVALAVGADVDYVRVEGPADDGGTERLILAESLLNAALKEPGAYRVLDRFKGRDLAGKHYQPLYTFLPVEQDYAYVVTGDFVSTEEGTGIVHIAPAFGQDDMEAGQAYGLPVLVTVRPDGTFIDAVTPWRGMWVKDADEHIIRELKSRGLMYRVQKYLHSYPFCWRCKSPLLYYARDTWFIKTTAYRDKMIALNNTINWVPDHIKSGRFGNWLEDLKDWALGRERYWGTPLPVWQCDNPDCGHMVCVGGVDELSKLSGVDQSNLDLHRPYVDEVHWACRQCNGRGTMYRVPELIDVWFDSGSMPVAQWGYPYYNQEMFREQYPADYICEAVDQTRGWFYSLHAIASMLFEQVAFKNVICLGHILDATGQKMSKSRPETFVEPWQVFDKYGADAFRWYMYTSSPPGEPRRFSMDLVGEVVTKFLLTLWNTYSFFVTYANLDGWSPDQAAPPVAERDPLDRWVLAELHALVQRVTEAYENYDVPGATRPIQTFVEELSNWYVRLSRRRFWKSEDDTDKLSAYATLYECLTTLAYLLAPAMPFMAETIYRNLVASVQPDAPESVHLARWPVANEQLIDRDLMGAMALAQRLVSLGRAARESANLRVRQPLQEAAFAVRFPAEREIVQTLSDLIASELNVKQVNVLDSADEVVTYTLNPLPAKLGRKFGKDFPRVQKALREGDPAEVAAWARALLSGQAIQVTLDGQTYEVAPDECEVRQGAAEGYAVAEEAGYLAALRTALTEDLILEGLAREIVRRVQMMRRDADFEISDRIAVTFSGSERVARALAAHHDYVAGETLAESVLAAEPPAGAFSQAFTIDDEDLVLSVRRVG